MSSTSTDNEILSLPDVPTAWPSWPLSVIISSIVMREIDYSDMYFVTMDHLESILVSLYERYVLTFRWALFMSILL